MRLNPVLEREVKVKMRGWRAPMLITLYLGLLTGMAALFFFAQEATMKYELYTSFNPRMVYDVFMSLLFFEMVLIMVITPGLTAASISGERERQTLDLLLCTRLSAFSIVAGKLAASISQVLLLVLASLPVFGMVFLYGGVTIADFFLYTLFFIATAVMIGSMGVCFSAFFKKSVFATVLSYVLVLLMAFGTSIGYSIFSSIYYPMTASQPTFWHIMLFNFCNPLVGFSSIMNSYSMQMGMPMSVPLPIPILQNLFMNHYSGMPMEVPVQPWVINIAFDAVAALLFILLSTLKLRPGRK